MHSKANGNPLLTLELFLNLLHTGSIKVNSEGNLGPTEVYMSTCHSMDDWSAVPVPRYALKINQFYLSQFISWFGNKTNAKPGLYEEALAATVLLKTASVLGKEFTIEALKHISPLKKDLRHDQKVED